MDSSKFAVKFFVEDPAAVPAEVFVPVFHSWIQQHAVPDHLLIDVADYQHVKDGPGTVLVAHEANIHLDKSGGRPGLLYVRKQPLAGDLRERLAAVFRAALAAAAKLEEHPTLAGRLRFRTDEAVLRIHDRLAARNTPETFEAVRPALEAVLADVYAGAPVELDFRPSAERVFEVGIKAPAAAAVATLAGRLAGATATV